MYSNITYNYNGCLINDNIINYLYTCNSRNKKTNVHYYLYSYRQS